MRCGRAPDPRRVLVSMEDSSGPAQRLTPPHTDQVGWGGPRDLGAASWPGSREPATVVSGRGQRWREGEMGSIASLLSSNAESHRWEPSRHGAGVQGCRRAGAPKAPVRWGCWGVSAYFRTELALLTAVRMAGPSPLPRVRDQPLCNARRFAF